MFIAQLIVNIAMAYAVIGAGFAIVFVIAGVGKIDPSAVGASVGFRLLILPGVAALWPWLLLRLLVIWIRGPQHPPLETNAHRRRAREVTR